MPANYKTLWNILFCALCGLILEGTTKDCSGEGKIKKACFNTKLPGQRDCPGDFEVKHVNSIALKSQGGCYYERDMTCEEAAAVKESSCHYEIARCTDPKPALSQSSPQFRKNHCGYALLSCSNEKVKELCEGIPPHKDFKEACEEKKLKDKKTAEGYDSDSDESEQQVELDPCESAIRKCSPETQSTPESREKNCNVAITCCPEEMVKKLCDGAPKYRHFKDACAKKERKAARGLHFECRFNNGDMPEETQSSTVHASTLTTSFYPTQGFDSGIVKSWSIAEYVQSSTITTNTFVTTFSPTPQPFTENEDPQEPASEEADVRHLGSAMSKHDKNEDPQEPASEEEADVRHLGSTMSKHDKNEDPQEPGSEEADVRPLGSAMSKQDKNEDPQEPASEEAHVRPLGSAMSKQDKNEDPQEPASEEADVRPLGSTMSKHDKNGRKLLPNANLVRLSKHIVSL